MPTRLIREGFLDSEKIDNLSTGAENFFVRLMLCADDYGRFDGRSVVIKNRAYPLKDTMKVKKIDDWMTECIKIGLIIRYLVKDKPYIEIIDFKQRLRIKKSKYPDHDGQMTDICPTDDGHVHAGNSHLSEEKRSEVEVEKEVEENVSLSPQYFDLAKHLKKRILETKQNKITDNTIENWANVVRLMVDRDKRIINDIRALIDECHDMPESSSGFTWRNNILSMGKLREKWNEGKIYIGMNKSSQEVESERIEREYQENIVDKGIDKGWA